MDINDLRKLQEKENMSYETIAELSGIPLDIVIKIFSGEIFHTMSTPNRMHQFLSINISTRMFNHIGKNKGKCYIYTAPLEVRLFADDMTWVEPDYVTKLLKYQQAGVREYWIVDPRTERTSESAVYANVMLQKGVV